MAEWVALGEQCSITKASRAESGAGPATTMWAREPRMPSRMPSVSSALLIVARAWMARWAADDLLTSADRVIEGLR